VGFLGYPGTQTSRENDRFHEQPIKILRTICIWLLII